MSEEKFSKCEEGEKKKSVSVEFRVFGKKKELKEKFREKKKSKCFSGLGFVPYTRWGAMLWNMAKIESEFAGIKVAIAKEI